MCLIAFSYQPNSEIPFTFISNRDESHDRPSIGIHFWFDQPDTIGGKDLKAGGSWLALNKNGKIAAITNQPFTKKKPHNPISRGKLIQNFLNTDISASEYTDYLLSSSDQYDGYHLIYGTFSDLHFFENQYNEHFIYDAGIHALSNTKDDLSLFKMERAKDILTQSNENTLDHLIEQFNDPTPNPHLNHYPDFIPKELASRNSAMFIAGNEQFGTVGTTGIQIRKDGKVTMKEIRYNRTQAFETTVKEFYLAN